MRTRSDVERYGTNPFERPTPVPAKHHLVVGMPVTYSIGSDQYAHFIIEVRRNGMEVVTSAATPADYAAKVAEIRATEDAGMVEYRLRLLSMTSTRRPDGSYVAKGSRSGALLFGRAESYRSPEF